MMRKIVLIFAIISTFGSYVNSQTTLSWRFANYEVVNAGAQLQFDVQVKADLAGTFHRDLQVYFDYNTAGFGSSVATGITVTPLSLMDTHYLVVNTADNTTSKIAIITEAVNEMAQQGNATYFNAMPTSYTGLFQVTMNIVDNTAAAGIAFDAALMDGGQYYQSTSAIEPVKYVEACNYDNDLLANLLSTAYGTITYANTGSQLLNNCTVTLLSAGIPVSSTDNNTSGYFSFSGIADGDYTLETSCSNITGGTDVLDVNMIRDYILGSVVLDPLPFLAADVDVTGSVNNIDYNLVRDRILGSGGPWAAPDYVFIVQNVTVLNGIGTVSYQGLCSGDPNGSFSF